MSLCGTVRVEAQSNPSIGELQNIFNNQQLLITYREGEVLYGTYYFLEVHYCQDGYYGLYGNSVKRTVPDNEQRSNWQEFGTWKVINQKWREWYSLYGHERIPTVLSFVSIG